MDTFGQKLRVARTRKGLSQPALAAAIDISPIMISRYENDKVEAPDIDIIMKLCGALGLDSPADLGFSAKGGRPRPLRLLPSEPASPREWALNPKDWPLHFFELHGYADPDVIAAMAEEMAAAHRGVENIDVQHARFWLSARRREDDAREAKKKTPGRHRSRGSD